MIEKAEDVSGYVNAAKHFVGTTIGCDSVSDVPTDGAGNITIPTTVRVTGILSLSMSTYRSEWHLTEIKAPLEYPPEAYVFTKSLEVLEKTETYYGTFAKKIQYSISGNVSPFAVTIVGYNLAGTVFAIWRMQGPVSGILDLSFAYDGWGLPGVGFYAHPNPAEVWNQYTYRFYNWK